MKTTTTIMEIIQSELIKDGHNEFSNDNQLSFFDKKHTFIHKVMRYDNDVKKIVNDVFFQKTYLNTEKSDHMFKRTFVNKFLNRQIGFQTLEAFSSQVVYVLLSKYDYINYLYDELDDFIKGKTTSETDDIITTLSDFRQLFSSLPQDNINMNLDNDTLNYADDNTISKTRDKKDGKQQSEQKRYDIDALLKIKDLLNELFIEFDKKCFLQVW